jgi:4-amino-4-deoxy-L-arabinose transferase-like glycosyltransferase
VPTKIIIFIYLIIAFIPRLYLGTFHNVLERPDGVTYITTGKNLMAGNGYINQSGTVELEKTPFYPILIGLTSKIIKDPEVAAKFVSIVFGTLLIIPVYFFGKALYGDKVGHFAAILVIFYPVLVQFSIIVLTESTYTFLFISSIMSGWYFINNEKVRYPVITGILFGISTITRPEASMFFLLFFVTFLFFKYNKKC